MTNKRVFFLNRNQVIKKLSIEGELWDQLCFIKGMIPFSPKTKTKNKTQTYFIGSALKKFKDDTFLKKVRQIKLWKKYCNNSRKNKKKINVNKHATFPFYDFEKIIMQRFPDFAKIFKRIDEIFTFSFFVIDNIFFENLISIKISDTFDLIFQFIILLKEVSTVNFILESDEVFHVDIMILNFCVRIMFPKKKNLGNQITRKTKIFSSFLELNLVLFKLIVHKLSRFNTNNNKFQDVNILTSRWNLFIFFDLKKISQCQKNKQTFTNVHNQLLQSSTLFIYGYFVLPIKNKSIEKWFVYAKNFYFPWKNLIFSTLTFCFHESMREGSILLLSFFLKISATRCKNDKKTIVYILNKDLISRSLISIYINFSWIVQSINSRTFLPFIIKITNSERLIGFNPLFNKFKKNPRAAVSNFRNKFRKYRIIENEKKSGKKNIIFYLKKFQQNVTVTHRKGHTNLQCIRIFTSTKVTESLLQC